MQNVELSYFVLTLYSLGLFYLLKITLFVFLEVWSGFKFFIWGRYGPQVDLKGTYGSWAVITGSTDGIGKQFALQLARKGMDIVLISDVNLESTAREIEGLHKVKVKTIQVDFSSTDVYEKIRTGLASLDIGILGTANKEPEEIAEQDEDFYKKILNVNVLSVLVNTKIVLREMKRKNRGLILNISSQSALFPCPYIGVYSSSKVFVHHVTSALNSELAETNVRVKCLTPGFVTTNLISHLQIEFWEKYFSFILPNAKTYVDSAVAIFNVDVNFSCGYWSHSLYMTILDALLTKCMLTSIIKSILLSVKCKKN